MFKNSLWAAVALGAAVLFGTAQAQRLANSQDRITDFSSGSLATVMSQLGAQVTRSSQSPQAVVSVVMPSNARFSLTPTACKAETGVCTGLSLQATFRFEGTTPATVNVFNQIGTPPKVVMFGERAILYEYLINEYGLARGDFDIYIGVFEFAIGEYLKFLTGGSRDLRSSASLRETVSLSQETDHVGTIPLEVNRHPNPYLSLGNAPDDYVITND